MIKETKINTSFLGSTNQIRAIYSNRAVSKAISSTDCSIRVYQSFELKHKPIRASVFFLYRAIN